MMRSGKPPSATVRSCLKGGRRRLAAAGIVESESLAGHLMAHVLGCSRPASALYAERMMTAAQVVEWEVLLRRAADHEPLQYLLEDVPFLDMDLKCDRRALIPRPETEELAARLIDSGFAAQPGSRVADVGTGSGCLALALARARPRASVYGVDVDRRALTLAAVNARNLGMHGRVQWLAADLLSCFAPASLDAVVSNPPYVADSEYRRLPPHIRRYEPRCALHGGSDGLLVLRRLTAQAAVVLKAGGRLALEIGNDQGCNVAGLLRAAGFRDIIIENDLAGFARYAFSGKAGKRG